MTRDQGGICGAIALAAGLLFSSGLPLHAQNTGLAARLQGLNRQLNQGTISAQDAGRVLRQRSDDLYTLMADDPAAAAAAALPAAQLDRLRSAAPGLLELRGQWQGPAVAVVEDDLLHNRQRTRWRIHVAGANLQLYFTGAAPALTCGHELKIQGFVLRDRVVAEVATPVAAVAAACTTSGVQQTAVLLVSFPSTPLPSNITASFVQNAFFGARSLNGYYSEISYGQASFAGAVFGPYTLDADYSCADTGLIEAAAIRAADPNVDLTKYTRLFIVMPDIGCGWEGSGEIGCIPQTSPAHGSFTASVSWISVTPAVTSDQMTSVAAHEAGHNFGLAHAHSLDFGTQPLGSSGGAMSEYGDPFSIMGVDTWFGHFNAQEKLALGWINNTQNVQTVQTGGTFTLSPLETASSGLQALRVQRGSTGAWLWLEYRQPGGSYELFSSVDNEVYSGALIHFDDGTGAAPLATDLLDFNPVQTPNNFLKSALPVGRTWSDPYSNLSLAVNGAGPSGLSVTVSYNNTAFATPGSLSFTAPPASQTPLNQSVSLTSSGPAFSFTVTAASSGNWLGAGPASGAVPATVTVTANPANLLAGTYNGTVTITVPGAVNSPLAIPVTLTVPSAGAAAYWTFDTADISGSQALDKSGNGNTGIVSNAASITGRVNQGLSFSGTGSYVAVPTNAAFELKHDLTLAAWIRTQSTTQVQDFIGKYDYTGSETGYMLQVLPSGVVNLHVGGNNLASGSRDATDTTHINDGQWHHVAVVIALGQNVTFYIDGTLSSTQPQVTVGWANQVPLYLGTSPGAYYGMPFTGALDEVRIYAGRLNAGEVQALVGAAAPIITSLVPANPPQGDALTLTVNGAGFVSGATVIEPDAPASPFPALRILTTTFVSPTQLTVAVPRDLTMAPGTLRFQVFNTYPTSPGSNIVSYTVAPVVPTISSLSPASTVAGGSDFVLTVNGTSFVSPCPCIQQLEPGAAVKWNGTALTTSFVSATQLTAIVPASLTAAAGTASVTVVNPGNVSSTAVSFTIASKSTPFAASCTPAAGPTQTGIAYSATCTASGGTAPYSWSIGAGALPAGLTLSAAAGSSVNIAGSPTAAGSYSFTVRAADSTSPTPQAITQSYSGTVSAPTPAAAVPAGYWTFDAADISGTQVLDRSGNSRTGTLVNAASVPGRINQALSFSGAGSYVAVPDSAALQLIQSLTFAAWIQTTNTTQKQDFLSKYDFTASEYGYMLQVLPSGVLNLHVGGNNLLGGGRDATDIRPINDGQWHHIAFVLNLGQNAAFYIDGQLSSTQPLLTAAVRNYASLYIGTFPGTYNGSPFTGSLDEVRIYSQALAASDITALVGAPVAPSPTASTVSVTPASVTLGPGQSQAFTANTAVVWSVAPNVGTISSTGIYTAPATVTAQQNVIVTATSQADSTKTAQSTVTLTATTAIAATGHWSFDTADLNGTQVLDRSGNGLTGALVNAASVPGRFNQALGFSGAGSYVSVPDNTGLRLTHDVTLAAWIKTTNTTQTQDFISKYDFTASETGYMLQMLPAGVVNFHVGGSNLMSGSRDVHDSTVINDGQWHHVAVVIALGQSVSFYVDGRLSSSQPMQTAPAGITAPLYLGTFPGSYNGLPFIGALDDVWICSRALTAAEIAIVAAGSGS